MSTEQPLKKIKSNHSHLMVNTKPRRLSREEIINKMENEQDAIVVRLLREIDSLKKENALLRNQLHHRKSTSYSTDDEVAIVEESDANYNFYAELPTPRNSFGIPTTPSHSRRPSSSSSVTSTSSSSIFPIDTITPSIHHHHRHNNLNLPSSHINMENVNGNGSNSRRRRRTSNSVYSNEVDRSSLISARNPIHN